MDLRTKAALTRDLQMMGLQLLSEQATKQTDLPREKRLCTRLTAVFLAEISGSKRTDHILKALQDDRCQHPELLLIARRLDRFISDLKLEMIDHLVGGLKNPKRSKLAISPELIEAATRDRRRTKKAPGTKSKSTLN